MIIFKKPKISKSFLNILMIISIALMLLIIYTGYILFTLISRGDPFWFYMPVLLVVIILPYAIWQFYLLIRRGFNGFVYINELNNLIKNNQIETLAMLLTVSFSDAEIVLSKKTGKPEVIGTMWTKNEKDLQILHSNDIIKLIAYVKEIEKINTNKMTDNEISLEIIYKNGQKADIKRSYNPFKGVEGKLHYIIQEES